MTAISFTPMTGKEALERISQAAEAGLVAGGVMPGHDPDDHDAINATLRANEAAMRRWLDAFTDKEFNDLAAALFLAAEVLDGVRGMLIYMGGQERLDAIAGAS